MFHRKRPPLPDSAPALLRMAASTSDPRLRFAMLDKARTLAPDDLSVRRALLMHGRAHLCPRDCADYSYIKCWLLHAFEHPEKHTEEQQQAMARELFDSPDLSACLEIAPDREKFLSDYLYDLCLNYARIFIAGESAHMPGIFGFTSQKKMPEYLARPAADVIRNIFLCPFLSAEEQTLLAGRFYRAYSLSVGGQVEPLDQALGEEICARLA